MLVVPSSHLSQATVAADASRNVPGIHADRWSTSAYAAAADPSPIESFDLGKHLQRCGRARGRLFAARCVWELVDRFLAPRFITTMVAIALLSALLAML